MIPSTLTDIRLGRDESGEETVAEYEFSGLAETPPILSERLVLTLPTGKVIKTGIVTMIEWIGKTEEKVYYKTGDKWPRKQYVAINDHSECIFHTGSSMYRWRKIPNENG